MEKIFEVTEVRLFVLESFPPQLRISASGIVPTRGWSHPQLKPHVHVQPPPDGIYDFDFIAERPGTLVPQMISLIHSDHVMTGFPDTLNGVRIHASQNSKTTLLDTGKPDRHPNRYTFSDGEGVKRVVFFPERFGPLGEGESDAGAHLEYNGPEGHLTFHGDDISQEETVLGTLISMVLQPNADAGGLDFALALPLVKLGGKAHQEFETVGFKIRSRGRMIKPAGPELTYEVLNLRGIAEDIPVL
jgi:hypothetical protein